MARVSRPLTNEELAKEERRDHALKIKQRLEDAASENLEVMASAGDPEARDAAARLRRALEDGGLEGAANIIGGMATRVVEQPPADHPAPVPQPVPVQRDRRRDEDRAMRQAHDLMQRLWQRWRKTAAKEGFPPAFRELALDMGEMGVDFIKVGLIADVDGLIRCVQMCVLQGRGEKSDEEGDTYRSEIEQMKADLRGEK